MSETPDAAVLPPWLVGRWVGTSSIYADVVDGQQSYTKHEVHIEIDAGGEAKVKMTRGPLVGQRWTPSYRCEAAGKLRAAERGFELEVETSSCAAAAPGSRARFSVERVGPCLLQWNRQTGTPPFEVGQIAVRREGGCKSM